METAINKRVIVGQTTIVHTDTKKKITTIYNSLVVTFYVVVVTVNRNFFTVFIFRFKNIFYSYFHFYFSVGCVWCTLDIYTSRVDSCVNRAHQESIKSVEIVPSWSMHSTHSRIKIIYLDCYCYFCWYKAGWPTAGGLWLAKMFWVHGIYVYLFI